MGNSSGKIALNMALKHKLKKAGVRPAQQVKYRRIAEKSLEGKSNVQISQEMAKTGCKISPESVSKILRKDEIKQMIEEQYAIIASTLPKATKNIINAVNSFSTDQHKDDKQISWEASKLVAQAHGVLPSAQTSIVHQTYIQNQTNNVIPAVIAELAQKHFGGLINLQSSLDNQEHNQEQKLIEIRNEEEKE